MGVGSFLLWPKGNNRNNQTQTGPTSSGASNPPASSQSQTQPQNNPQQPTDTSTQPQTNPQSNPQTNPPGTPGQTSPATPQTAEQAITAYYALVPGNLEAGFATLTDAFKVRRKQTFQTYQTFWSQYTSVQVSDPAPQGDNVVTVTVTYMQGSAVHSTERHTYTLVQQNGKWMIDNQA